MAAGNFPQPRQLSIGRSGWLIDDIRAFIETRPRGVATSKRHRAKGRVP
jgi:predicted DNA-binding transcriptional regulator AlpA